MPRASWRGFLRLSLVTCPVYLSPATTGTKPIRLHQVWQPAPVEVKRGRVTGSECRAAGFGIIGTAARRRPYQPCGAPSDDTESATPIGASKSFRNSNTTRQMPRVGLRRFPINAKLDIVLLKHGKPNLSIDRFLFLDRRAE